ncbi:MAG: 2-dehydropantoate 2-reductase [Myxococcota bacterium]|jgi:2-dehydropantoate 2-reductase
MPRLIVGVMGAGAVGTYAGVRLSAAGHRVILVGRRRLVDSRDTLGAVTLDGRSIKPSANLVVSEVVDPLAEADVCLMAVKGGDSEAAAAQLVGCLPSDRPVVSLQNGLRNPARIRRVWSGPVIPGVVAPNVFLDDNYVAHQATKGPFYVGAGADSEPLSQLVASARAGGFDLRSSPVIRDIMAGKLLMNLGNGVGAALGLGWAELLGDSDARWCFSECILEGLGVMRTAGYRPKGAIALPPGIVGRALRLPGFVIGPAVRGLAGATEGSRSSTLQDLDRGRPTEIGDLNGEIVALAAGEPTPANTRVLDTVRAHEAARAAGRSPDYPSPAALRSLIRAA